MDRIAKFKSDFISVDRSGVGQGSHRGITGLKEYGDTVQRLGMAVKSSDQRTRSTPSRILASLLTNPNPRAHSTFAHSAPILATIFILFGIGYTIDYNSKFPLYLCKSFRSTHRLRACVFPFTVHLSTFHARPTCSERPADCSFPSSQSTTRTATTKSTSR